MSLHGSIDVNGWPMGRWSARRVSGEEGALCAYECVVEFKGKQVGPFQVLHHYDEGAISLAVQVLTEAVDLAKVRP